MGPGHIRFSWLGLAGAAVLQLFVLGCEPRSIHEEPAPAEAASLIVRGDRLFIPARINGVETQALLDSGAEISFVDTAFAEQIGLVAVGTQTARGTGGEQQASFAKGVTLEAAGIRLEDRVVAVLDLSDIAERLIGAPLTLVIGRELFGAARFSIDIENGEIKTVSRDVAPKGVRLAMETHKGIQTFPVSVEGGAPAQADFDLGNGSEVLIGGDYADRTGLSAPERIVRRTKGGGIGGEIERDIVVLKELEIAGETFRDIEAAIDRTENAADVNIGVRLLRHFRMTVDFAENSLWLEPR